MKIDRLKRGYRIRLSDSEFAALSLLATEGWAALEGLPEHEAAQITKLERRGLNTITGPGSWALASDRRATK